jgi:hypothetical protein
MHKLVGSNLVLPEVKESWDFFTKPGVKAHRGQSLLEKGPEPFFSSVQGTGQKVCVCLRVRKGSSHATIKTLRTGCNDSHIFQGPGVQMLSPETPVETYPVPKTYLGALLGHKTAVEIPGAQTRWAFPGSINPVSPNHKWEKWVL